MPTSAVPSSRVHGQCLPSGARSNKGVELGLSSRMPSSVYRSPRRPTALQLHTLRTVADRSDILQVELVPKAIPRRVEAVPSLFLLSDRMGAGGSTLLTGLNEGAFALGQIVIARPTSLPGAGLFQHTWSSRRSSLRQTELHSHRLVHRAPLLPVAVAPPIQVPVG